VAHDRKFRIAIQLTHGPSGEAWLEMARKAERDGFAVLSMPDHFTEQFAPLVALSAAAAVTKSIRFSMFVLANDMRHPGMLAKEAATLDVISNGRLELGVGAGWTKTEYDALGVPFDKPSIRIERLGESVKILRGAFTGEPVSFSGKHYRVTELSIKTRPVQKRLPILLGGGGPKMLSLAAREADIIGIASDSSKRFSMTAPLGGFALDKVKEQAGWVREAAGARYDSLELNIRILGVEVMADRDAAARKLAAQLNVPAEDLLDSPFVFLGTLEQIESQMKRMRDVLGVSYYTISQRHAEPLLPLVARITGK
jgi:probable F420-dependent oxidoreductase